MDKLTICVADFDCAFESDRDAQAQDEHYPIYLWNVNLSIYAV